MLETYLKECLYFTANRLSRIMTKMAEEEFANNGLSPNAAYLLMIVFDKEGISQKEIGQHLHLQPSTVTRLIEKLMSKGLIYNRIEGRTSFIYATEEGKALESIIYESWLRLRRRYSTLIGEKEGDALAVQLDKVSDQLENLS